MFVEDKISVIVPVYNASYSIERCFNSVISQKYTNLEIILTDDGGIDEGGCILDYFAIHFSNVIIIHKNNEGLSEARNDGIEISNGENIIVVDSDDYILPNMLSKMRECKEKEKCDIVVCQWQWENKNGIRTIDHSSIDMSRLIGPKSGIELVQLTTFGGYYDGIYCSPWNKLYAAKVLKKTKFFGRKYEDYRIADTLAIQGYNYYVMNEVFYIYCENENSLTQKKQFKEEDWMLLDILFNRITMFSIDKNIAEYTKKIYCDIFIYNCILASEKRINVPKQYVDNYRKFYFSVEKQTKKMKRKITLLCFYVAPKTSSKLILWWKK